MPNFSMRHGRPLGISSQGWGGAGLNMGLEALAGDSDMITTFDDFNGVVPAETFNDATNWETMGWVITDDPVGSGTVDLVGMNAAATVAEDFSSCIRLFGGTADDRGGNMQLDRVNSSLPASGGHVFPHLWVPETAAIPTSGGVAGEVLDNSTWVFACRIGVKADVEVAGAGNFDSKAFVGWAAAADVSILDHDGKTAGGDENLTATAGELQGFHVSETGRIWGVSKRTAGDAITDGTTITPLGAAGMVDGTVLNGALTAGDTMWFDLALRMDITNMSDDAANGSTTFYWRGPLNIVSPASGNAGTDEFANPGEGYLPWRTHGTVLLNETPNPAISLVPTIEFINGPTGNADGILYVDWWAMGRSRPSR